MVCRIRPQNPLHCWSRQTAVNGWTFPLQSVCRSLSWRGQKLRAFAFETGSDLAVALRSAIR